MPLRIEGDPEKNPLLKIILGLEESEKNEEVIGSLQDRLKGAAKKVGMEVTEAVGTTNKMGQALGMQVVQTTELNKQWQQLNNSLKQTQNTVTGIMGYTLVRVGNQFMQFGKSILSPFQEFIKAEGTTDPMARRYLSASRELEYSVIRIGRTFADTIVPAMEAVAKLAQQTADFIEKHPELAKVAIGVAAGFVSIGSLAVAFGAILNALAAIRIVGKVVGPIVSSIQAGMGAAAGGGAMAELAMMEGGGFWMGIGATLKSLTATLLPLAGAISGFAAIAAAMSYGGSRIYQKYAAENGLNPNQTEQLMEYEQQYPVVGWIAGNAQNMDDVNRILNAMGESAEVAKTGLAGLIEELNKSPKKAEIVDAFDKYQKDLADAGEKHLKVIGDIQDTYNERNADSEEKYLQNRQDLIDQYNEDTQELLKQNDDRLKKLLDNYNLEEARAEEDYYNDRMTMARDYGIQELRDEEDFQKQMRRAQEDHNQTMLDLAGRRDALGMIQEQRRYEKERERAEEDHLSEVARRRQDYAIQLADLAKNFAIQRQRRLEDFERQRQELEDEITASDSKRREALDKKLKDLDEEHAKDLEENKQWLNDKVAQENEAYAEQLDNLEKAIIDRINTLDPFLLNTEQAIAAHTQQIFNDLVAWMAQQATPFTNPYTGGSTQGGVTVHQQALGGDWWVTKPTLFLAGEAGAERATFTPAALLNRPLPASPAVTNKQVTLNDQRRFYNGISNAERRAIQQDTLAVLAEVF